MRIPTLAIAILSLLPVSACNKKAPDLTRGTDGTGQPARPALEKRFAALESAAELAVPTGEPGRAFAVAPDGLSYAVGGSDGSVIVVPRGDGDPRVFVGHREMVLEAEWTPDGRSLLTGGADNKLIVWDSQSGAIKQDIQAHNGDVKALAVTFDGTLAATGSVADDVRVWRLADGKRTAHFEGHSSTVYAVAWSSNGRHVFSGARDSQVRRWSLEKGKDDAPPIAFRNTVVAIRWSPDHSVLWVLGLTGELAAIDPVEFTVKHRRRVAAGRVLDMDVAADGTIGLGHRDGRVSLWSPEEDAAEPLVPPFEAHRGEVRQVRFLPESAALLTLGEDATVGMWDARTGQAIGPRKPLPAINGSVRAMTVSSTSDAVAVASGGYVFTYAVGSKSAGRRLDELGAGGAASLAFTPDGKMLLVGRDNGQVVEVPLPVPAPPPADAGPEPAPAWASHPVHRGTVRHIVPTGDGTRIVTAGDDIAIHYLDTRTWEPTRSVTDHASPIVALAVDPTGKRLASSEEDRITIVRYIETNNIQWTRRGHHISHLTFSPNGEVLAMCEDRRIIALYDVEERREIKQLKGNPATIRAMAYHPDGDALLIVDDHGTLRAWNVETGALLASANAGRGRPTALGIGDDGKLVVTGGMDPRGSVKAFRITPEQTP